MRNNPFWHTLSNAFLKSIKMLCSSLSLCPKNFSASCHSINICLIVPPWHEPRLVILPVDSWCVVWVHIISLLRIILLAWLNRCTISLCIFINVCLVKDKKNAFSYVSVIMSQMSTFILTVEFLMGSFIQHSALHLKLNSTLCFCHSRNIFMRLL